MQNDLRYINSMASPGGLLLNWLLGGLAVLPAKFINSSASRNHILIFSFVIATFTSATTSC
jgi:hypothetical protein